jgi:hypothetical protein
MMGGIFALGVHYLKEREGRWKIAAPVRRNLG